MKNNGINVFILTGRSFNSIFKWVMGLFTFLWVSWKIVLNRL